MQDDVMPPVIDQEAKRPARPWRPSSLLTLAILCGAIASTAIGYLNASRLGVEPAKRLLILLIGVVELTLVTLVYTRLDGGGWSALARALVRGAVLVGGCALQLRLQRPRDEEFQRASGEYGSLWRPGFVAAVCGVVLEVALQGLVEEWL